MESPVNGTMVQADGLTKHYGPFIGVHRASFAIPHGQIVALIGPNGAGKSTLIRMLTGYLPPSEGTAAIGGFDIQRDRLAAVAQIGYLPENGPLYPDLTPVDVLRFFGEARRMPPTDLDVRIRAVADACAIGQILDKPIGQLSKGLRQRVGLAQALLHDPPVLIMDEPTAGLDPNQIVEFHAQVRNLSRTKTLLVSTHILSEVQAIADRVLLIHCGVLVFDGSPEQFAAGGSLEASFLRLTHAGRSGTAAEMIGAGRERPVD
jgi:gliding motility-associated transport system ATP-binding protein